jgi:ATP-dependent RNA helicase DDX55/SPB4
MLLIGGNNPATDVGRFLADGAHIIIGTPGRLLDMFGRKQPGFDLTASVKALEVLILDEADRLLDMGFKSSLDTIFSYLPKQRRTGLFSATQTREVEDLIRAGLRNPVHVAVKERSRCSGNLGAEVDRKTPSTLSNFYMVCEADEKLNLLVRLLRTKQHEKHIIFFSTCSAVDYFSKVLQLLLKKVTILAIHGKKENRNKVFAKFRDLPSGVLICTDVMGRGVDIPDVNWVIQYDPPTYTSNFVHRCGRTARIGHAGTAVVFLLPAEDAFVNFMQNQKVPLEPYALPSGADNILPNVQQMALQDRLIYEKGLQAYVSFVQSYKKHECSRIFRIKDLDLGRLATGFGLLHLPRMPELKGKTTSHFQQVDFDYSKIPFKDKVRERQRQEKLKQFAETGIMPGKKIYKPKTQAWSKQKEKKEKKKQKKEVKEMRGKKRPRTDDDGPANDDMDDFTKDIRLMKKLKAGKISKEEFDKAFDADS